MDRPGDSDTQSKVLQYPLVRHCWPSESLEIPRIHNHFNSPGSVRLHSNSKGWDKSWASIYKSHRSVYVLESLGACSLLSPGLAKPMPYSNAS